MSMKICVGCQEYQGVKHVAGLGWVCDYCSEVVPIVFEVEIERVREARAQVQKFVDDLQNRRV